MRRYRSVIDSCRLMAPAERRRETQFVSFLVSRDSGATHERMQELYLRGEIVLSSTGKSLSRKKYLRDAEGTPVADLWDDVNRSLVSLTVG